MHTRNAAALVLALATVSGCAAVRPRWLGGASLGAPVRDPAQRRADGRVRARRGGAAAQRHRHGRRRLREGRRTPIPTRPCCACGWRRSTCATASSTRRASSASAWSRRSPTTSTRSRCWPGIDSGARSRRRRDRASTSASWRTIPTCRRPISTSVRSTESAARSIRPSRRCSRLIARNPSSLLGYYYLGRVYAASGQLDQAEQYYLEALKLSPQSELVLTDLAVAYELQGRGAEGRGALRAHPGAESRRAWWCGVGSAGCTPGRSGSTRRSTQFRELEKVDADPREARTKMGLIYFEKGQLERAATEFNLVLASAPDDVRVRYYLAAVHAELGRDAARARRVRRRPAGLGVLRRRAGAAGVPAAEGQPRRGHPRTRGGIEGASRQPRADGVPGVALPPGEAVRSRGRAARADRRALAEQRSLSLHARRGVRRGQRQGSRHRRRCARRSS